MFFVGVALVSRLRIFSADEVFLGRKGQNHHCEISGTTFYTFYVSPHLLLRLSKSFRTPQLNFFSIVMQTECSISNAPCGMPSFSPMIFEVTSAGPPLIIVCLVTFFFVGKSCPRSFRLCSRNFILGLRLFLIFRFSILIAFAFSPCYALLDPNSLAYVYIILILIKLATNPYGALLVQHERASEILAAQF